MKTSDVKESSTSEWHTCHGEVGRLSRHLRWRRRSIAVTRTAFVLAFALIAFSANYFYADSISALEANVATGSTCDHYMEEMRGFYCDHSRSELDVKLWDHISTCPDCRRTFSFYGKISEGSNYAHSAQKRNATRAASANHPVSFEDLLKGRTFAMQR
jgi:hypothetical protein